MEIAAENETSSDEAVSSGSDSEKELITTLEPPKSVARPRFGLLPEADRVELMRKYTDRLPSGYARTHCPTLIRLRTSTPDYMTLIQNALFDAVLISAKLPINPMELLIERNGDVYDVMIMTKDTLDYLIDFLKRPNCSSHLLDGPDVVKNKHYAPATADK